MPIFPEITSSSDFVFPDAFINNTITGGSLILETAGILAFKMGSVKINLQEYGDAVGVANQVAAPARPTGVGADIPIVNGDYFLRFSLDGGDSSAGGGAWPQAPMSFYCEPHSAFLSDEFDTLHDSNSSNMLVARFTVSGGTVTSKTMLKNADDLTFVENLGITPSDHIIGNNINTYTSLGAADITLNWSRRPEVTWGYQGWGGTTVSLDDGADVNPTHIVLGVGFTDDTLDRYAHTIKYKYRDSNGDSGVWRLNRSYRA